MEKSKKEKGFNEGLYEIMHKPNLKVERKQLPASHSSSESDSDKEKAIEERRRLQLQRRRGRPSKKLKLDIETTFCKKIIAAKANEGPSGCKSGENPHVKITVNPTVDIKGEKPAIKKIEKRSKGIEKPNTSQEVPSVCNSGKNVDVAVNPTVDKNEEKPIVKKIEKRSIGNKGGKLHSSQKMELNLQMSARFVVSPQV